MFLDIMLLQQLTHNHSHYPPAILDNDMSDWGETSASMARFCDFHNLHPPPPTPRGRAELVKWISTQPLGCLETGVPIPSLGHK